MAAIKASVNLFALLDGNDPGDKRLVDFDSQLKEQAGQTKKKPASPGYKPKKGQPSGPAKKKPAAAAASTKKKPTSAAASGFKSDKNSPVPASGYKASSAAVVGTAASMPSRSVNKQTIPAQPAPAPAPPAHRTTDLTSVLFAFPSARERIFKQRQEEFERRQAKVRQEEYERQQQAKANGGGVSGDDEGKSKSVDATPADKKNGKTHGVRVQQDDAGYHKDVAKQKPVAAVKVVPTPAVKEPKVAPVLLQAPPPPPSIDDIVQFPSLK